MSQFAASYGRASTPYDLNTDEGQRQHQHHIETTRAAVRAFDAAAKTTPITVWTLHVEGDGNEPAVSVYATREEAYAALRQWLTDDMKEYREWSGQTHALWDDSELINFWRDQRNGYCEIEEHTLPGVQLPLPIPQPVTTAIVDQTALGDPWEDDETHTPADWQEEVASGSTRSSYRAWVMAQRDQDTMDDFNYPGSRDHY